MIMNKTRTFISFDYDNDINLKNLLVGQAKNNDSPFEITDMSIKAPIDNNWIENAKRRIKSCNVVAVICGKHTDSAIGVSKEIQIAQEENIPYFLLCGESDGSCKKPKAARTTDKVYRWTWDNLKALIGGAR